MAKGVGKKIAITTVVAAAAGYVTGILTAPKSGKETRADIKRTAAKSVKEAERELKKLHTQLAETIDKAKGQASKAHGQAKKEYEAAMKMAQKAKEKSKTILSAVHEKGVAGTDDEDLQNAIVEARNAAKHLKTFLKK